jgi:glycogen debranching enzyme
MCIWQIHSRWPDKAFLQEVFPKLLAWHRWWPKHRDGRHDGLLEWGSANAGEQGARWETGWDDTVHYEGSHMDGETLNAYAVDLSALWAMDAEYLALIADAVGHGQEAADLRAERKRTIDLINEKLWNPDLGIYCSRLWDGKFLTRLTPMNFYPLIAGAPDADRARRCLSVMTDPKRFWGTWVLPTVAYDDPVWPQQDYWRGKVWAPVNYLVSKGVLRYADSSVANELAAKSVELFMRNWRARGVCGENYLSSTGEQSSDPHYTWGSLLCLVGIENICSFEPDGKLRLNGTLNQRIRLRNVPIAGKPYEIEVEPGDTRLMRDGRTVLHARGTVIHAQPPR